MKAYHRATIRYGEGKTIEMFYKHNKDLECSYNTTTGVTIVWGKIVAEHPAFKDVVQFEGWCNTYIYEHDLKKKHGILKTK